MVGIDILPKMIYWWQINIWKYTQHYMPLINCKLKQWATIVYETEWWKYKKLIISNASEDVEQEEILFIADGNAKWYSIWEGGLEVSSKAKCSPTISSSYHIPPTSVENLYP